MTVDIKGVHYDVSDSVKEKLENKLKRFEFADNLIVNMDFTITREKQYKLEVNVHFRWGQTGHIKIETFDLWKGLDTLLDKLHQKVSKEKEKVQDHGKQDHIKKEIE